MVDNTASILQKKKYTVWNNPECKNLFEAFLTEYSKYFPKNEMDKEEKWINTLNAVQKYIDENDKRPSETDKDPREKSLSQWLTRQLVNYRNEKMNTERKQLFEELLDDYPHIFKPTKRQRTE